MGQEQKQKLLRVGLVALGVLLLAGVLLALRPPCPFLQGTGYYCGACGVTRMVEAQPGITVRREEVTALPAPGQGITLVASGPLT